MSSCILVYYVTLWLLCLPFSDSNSNNNTWFSQPLESWRCDRPWPQVHDDFSLLSLSSDLIHFTSPYHQSTLLQMELLVAVNVQPLESNKIVDMSRLYEWFDIFLRSYLLFWPVHLSKTSVRFLYDGEHNGTSDLSNFLDKIAPYTSQPERYGNLFITSNDLYRYSSVYGNRGTMRQQYLSFYADKYSSAEYIGLAGMYVCMHVFIQSPDTHL